MQPTSHITCSDVPAREPPTPAPLLPPHHGTPTARAPGPGHNRGPAQPCDAECKAATDSRGCDADDGDAGRAGAAVCKVGVLLCFGSWLAGVVVVVSKIRFRRWRCRQGRHCLFAPPPKSFGKNNAAPLLRWVCAVVLLCGGDETGVPGCHVAEQI